MHILLAYDSLSGNTREAATLVNTHLQAAGHAVTEICVSRPGDCPDIQPDAYDLIVLGTWTGGLGRTPDGMKHFVARLFADGNAPAAPIALFGTGETQWGIEHFCGALDRINKYAQSPYPLLKIEQMPTNQSALTQIADWVAEILALHTRHT